MSGRLLRCGERAVLVEVADLDTVLRLNDVVRELAASGAGPWAQVLDVVPAARTLYVATAGVDALRAISRELDALLQAQAVQQGLTLLDGRSSAARTVEIEVHYDGPDLDDVAALTGLTVDEVIDAHTATPWRVAFGGFAPGFAYLVDGDHRLVVSRRSQPRTVVPAGAVGLAGAFSGIYPRQSPGGWQLLGHTEQQLWDVDRTPPALLQPGETVRFVAVSRP